MGDREERVLSHIRALEEEQRIRELHADARAVDVTGRGGAGFRLLLAAGLPPVAIEGRLAIVLPLVPIRSPMQPGYFETRFFEDAEVLA